MYILFLEYATTKSIILTAFWCRVNNVASRNDVYKSDARHNGNDFVEIKMPWDSQLLGNAAQFYRDVILLLYHRQ